MDVSRGAQTQINKSNPSLLIGQVKADYHDSIELFLLVALLDLKKKQDILDVGPGSGIVPLLIFSREPNVQIIVIEIQFEVYKTALENVGSNAGSASIQLIIGYFLEWAPTLKSEVST